MIERKLLHAIHTVQKLESGDKVGEAEIKEPAVRTYATAGSSAD